MYIKAQTVIPPGTPIVRLECAGNRARIDKVSASPLWKGPKKKTQAEIKARAQFKKL